MHDFGNLPEYKAIDAPHRQFHGQLVELAVAHRQGQRNQASEAMRRLEVASSEVTRGLAALERAIASKPVVMVPGSTSADRRRREVVLN